ncbi:L,D-transpeptidase family protein [Aminobacter sp. HY435]|uniref:L,D-transpeptidase family protein n=1 Tax=Aminobacter sp. HY435 TaxID=2970917 RepID=UPI0022B976EC|nr:L,D-transpeptidase family protein [Aminobacter sp. HY435]
MTISRIACVGFALLASLVSADAEQARIELVRVNKSERKLELVSGERVVRSYGIALGANPVGHKLQEGDERTPEGRYVLDWRNPDSAFTKSIHISYPDADDVAAAKRAGVEAGGMIMIHGQSKGFGWWSWLMQLYDWTNGCIAVTDEDMAEIWQMVENGTPIEINP